MHIELFAQIQDATEAARQVLEQNAETPIIPQETTLSVWELIKMGGWYIMGPLGLMSLIAVYIIIERSMAIRRALRDEKDFMAKIRDYIHEGKIDSARNLCQTSNTPVARMLEKGINRIGKPLKDIEVSIENQGKLEVYQLESGLPIIATVSGAAPMIGFLGTVIGMVVTFHTMEVSGAGVELSKLSGGMMQAMITTVAGLIIGIPAYVGYNLLTARINKVVQKMEQRTIEFMEVLDSPAK
ncbi:MAG: MotA/TolQ/ExbB proton channel family protein [Flavobacteriales bacterium]|nr:MotA/TolQ/ExbB proton channel family protein [Flavobacteriales bacterium]MBP6641466.1 MotA/TolQ/ExbB proton channel family protein [Flavobacteriales bacterium]MBP7155324.1 MotA/TolQ/ExbB proton channel family protein [Flavobacteriales bacterium]HQV74333.1 MotA/TolQ/ExbB proton channel family protein [Flavobacteriales bacterium]HQW40095.1 MotA/TolQ/ExbB proton channel family protein [Flavobacteriales bacterium]